LSFFQVELIRRFFRAPAPEPLSFETDCFRLGVVMPAIIARMQLPDPSPEFLTKFHLAMMVVWLTVTPVTLKYPESVMWVAFMSQYANFVGHFASWDAARAEDNDNTDEIMAELVELRRLVEALRPT
jgi:hypothetical protein